MQRYTNLVKQNAISSQTLDTQRALVAQLEATIKGDDATIENAAVQLGYTTITAPISGRTGIRLVDQGNIVHAADATGLVVITQLQPISVIFTLPEDTLPEIAREMASGPLEVAILSRDEKTELDRGTLALVDNQIASATATIKLKATLPNNANLLWPGQFVKARLKLRTQRNVLTVPPNAVQRGAQGLFAYVVKPDQTARAAAAQGRPDRRPRRRHRGRVAGGRTSRHRRPVPPAARLACRNPHVVDQSGGSGRAMNVSTPFIKRPIATSLLMVGIFLAGLAAFPLLPVAALPQVDFPTISVSASLPGAARRRWRRAWPHRSSGSSAPSPA